VALVSDETPREESKASGSPHRGFKGTKLTDLERQIDRDAAALAQYTDREHERDHDQQSYSPDPEPLGPYDIGKMFPSPAPDFDDPESPDHANERLDNLAEIISKYEGHWDFEPQPEGEEDDTDFRARS
jgi:hypothetical protein